MSTQTSEILNPELKSILNSIPEINAGLMYESDDESEEEHSQIKSIMKDKSQIDVSLHQIDTASEIQHLLSHDLLQPGPNYPPEIHSVFSKYLQSSKIYQLSEILFWLVNMIKFQPKRSKLIVNLRLKLVKCFSRVVTTIPPPQEKTFALLQFFLGYLVHSLHYKILQKQRAYFDIRFILDCYHVVFYELTGVLVSDLFVYSNLKRIFGERLFMFKEEGTLDLTNVDAELGPEFAKVFNGDEPNLKMLQNSEGYFPEDRNECLQLMSELKEKFSYFAGMKYSEAYLIHCKVNTEILRRLDQLSSKENFEEILRKRAAKINNRNKKKKRGIVTEPKNEDPGFGSTEPTNLEQNVSSVHIDLEGAEDGSAILEEESDNFEVEQTELPRLKKKYVFNCSQISPPLRELLKGSSGVVNKKKTIGFSSYNVPDLDVEAMDKKFQEYLDERASIEKNKPKPKKKKKSSEVKLEQFQTRLKLKLNSYNADEKMRDYFALPKQLQKKFKVFHEMKDVTFYLYKKLKDFNNPSYPIGKERAKLEPILGKYQKVRENFKKWEARHEKEEAEKKLQKEKEQKIKTEQYKEAEKSATVVRTSFLGFIRGKLPTARIEIKKMSSLPTLGVKNF